MHPDNRNKLRTRVVGAAESALANQGYVSAIDVLTGIGWLDHATLKRWRQGQLSLDNFLMAVKTETNGGVHAGVPVPLFKLPERSCPPCINAGITPEGRFLVVTTDNAPETSMRVLFNWPATLKPPGPSRR